MQKNTKKALQVTCTVCTILLCIYVIGLFFGPAIAGPLIIIAVVGFVTYAIVKQDLDMIDRWRL